MGGDYEQNQIKEHTLFDYCDIWNYVARSDVRDVKSVWQYGGLAWTAYCISGFIQAGIL